MATKLMKVTSAQWVEQHNAATLHARLVPASFQRNVQPQQVDAIVKYLEAYGEAERPSLGVVTIAHYRERMYCVDGQHRLHAYATLAERGVDVPILALHHVLPSFRAVRSLFAAVNKCVAVPDFLLSEEHAAKQLVVKRVVQLLQCTHRPFFVHAAGGSERRRPNRPRMRPHELEERLFQSGHVRRVLESAQCGAGGGCTDADEADGAAVEECAHRIVDSVEALNTGLAALTHAQLFDVLKTFRELRYGEALPKVEGLAASIASLSLKGGHKPLYLGLFPNYAWLDEYDAVCGMLQPHTPEHNT